MIVCQPMLTFAPILCISLDGPKRLIGQVINSRYKRYDGLNCSTEYLPVLDTVRDPQLGHRPRRPLRSSRMTFSESPGVDSAPYYYTEDPSQWRAPLIIWGRSPPTSPTRWTASQWRPDQEGLISSNCGCTLLVKDWCLFDWNKTVVDDDFTQFPESHRPFPANDVTVFHELSFYLLRALIGCLWRLIREFCFRSISKYRPEIISIYLYIDLKLYLYIYISIYRPAPEPAPRSTQSQSTSYCDHYYIFSDLLSGHNHLRIQQNV